MRRERTAIIADEERERVRQKADFLLKSDISMQFIFKLIIPISIFILNFGLFLITILNPSILRIVAIGIFFVLSIVFIINIKSYGGVKQIGGNRG